MKIHRVTTPAGRSPDFVASMREATQIADGILGRSSIISWYDRMRDIESPSYVALNRDSRGVETFWAYAKSRGGILAVEYDGGRFVFCFRQMKN